MSRTTANSLVRKVLVSPAGVSSAPVGVSLVMVAPSSVSNQFPKVPLPKATVMVSGAPPAPLVIHSGGMRMAPVPLR